MKITEIFTPSDYPLYTYVHRDEDKLEARLRESLDTPGEIVSISGPSKSGKTVLIENVAGRDNLITIAGGGIENANEIWEKALDWMETPSQVVTTATTTFNANVSAGAKGKVGIPILATAGLEGSIGAGASHAKAKNETRTRFGMAQVVKEISNSDFVLLIDDFHYMRSEVQTEVAKQIKEAARLGVKICTASVPHRSDDVVRSNPELRGRVRAIDTQPWNVNDLIKIGSLGFLAAGIKVPETTIKKLAIEASTSPQLMQAICLQACFTIKWRETVAPIVDRDFSQEELTSALEETSTRSDFASLLRNMHSGPKVRGTERKDYLLSDGTRGDVYRALLVAMKADPPTLSFQSQDLTHRIQKTCKPEMPQQASISTACTQIARMAKDMFPSQRVVDWDGDPINLLNIEDPYFLFYLRWSDKMRLLAKT